MTRDESQSPDHVTDHDNLSDDAGSDDNSIDFGFRQVNRADKVGLVRGVFDSVANRYDLMNDLMSGGVHRLWKAAMIDWMAPQPHQTLIDLAGGTGDIGQRFLRAGGGFAHITDINESMLMAGKKRRDLQSLANRMNWCNANAEQLPFADNAADFVTIAFGLRNVTDRPAALAEAHRVLKAGGRFLCLEFSQVDNAALQRLYDAWSFSILPTMGQMVAGDAESYRYLVESIRQFPRKEILADMFADAGFAQIRIRSMTGNIACIHSGWKMD
jgi:demethylmenaquinone methyltransferase/2-methoxy-6-polyprenyl-1,4-benzoquinol methylase